MIKGKKKETPKTSGAKVFPSVIEEILTSGAMIVPSNVDEILDRVVTAYGNSAHIPVPSKHIGKKARIIIQKSEDKKG